MKVMKHKGGPCTASPCLMPNTTPNVYHFMDTINIKVIKNIDQWLFGEFQRKTEMKIKKQN